MSTIAQPESAPKSRMSSVKDLFIAIGLGIGGVLLFLALTMPEFAGARFRAPWIFVVIYNLVGPWGILAIAELLSLAVGVGAIRGLMGKK